MRSLVWLAGGMRGVTHEGYNAVSVACVWLTFPDEPTSTPPARGFEYWNRVDLCRSKVHHINVRIRSHLLTASRSRRQCCTLIFSYLPASPSIDTIVHVAYGPLIIRPSDLTRLLVQRSMVEPDPESTPCSNLSSAACIAHGQLLPTKAPCTSQTRAPLLSIVLGARPTHGGVGSR